MGVGHGPHLPAGAGQGLGAQAVIEALTLAAQQQRHEEARQWVAMWRLRASVTRLGGAMLPVLQAATEVVQVFEQLAVDLADLDVAMEVERMWEAD